MNFKARQFNQTVVANIMSGRQTQDRRPLKTQPDEDGLAFDTTKNKYFDTSGRIYKPTHKVGDIIGIRERVRVLEYYGNNSQNWGTFQYEVDGVKTESIRVPKRLKPLKVDSCVPNGCFKELIRTFVKVTEVGFERIRDISHDDAVAEGCEGGYRCSPTKQFVNLWESIYPGSWERNDWCEKIKFKLTEKPCQ